MKEAVSKVQFGMSFRPLSRNLVCPSLIWDRQALGLTMTGLLLKQPLLKL